MKKILLLFGIVLVVIALVGADLRQQKETLPPPDEKPCYGYTIIEFGKGVNCRGDTVRLTKVRGGGQALAQANGTSSQSIRD